MTDPSHTNDPSARAEEAEEANDATSKAPRDRGAWAWLKRHGKWLLFVVGLFAIGALIRETGAEKVGRTIVGAGPWWIAVIGLEITNLSMDTFVARALLGEHAKRAPTLAYVRSQILAYGVMVLLPAGRAGGDVGRAAVLGPWLGDASATDPKARGSESAAASNVGTARAGAACARGQGITLLANAIISVPCFIAVSSATHPLHPLALLIAGNAVVTAFIGGGILEVTRRAKVGGFLAKRFRSMVKWGPAFDEALRTMPVLPLRAIAFSTFGRLAQTVQYGIILFAVGGALTHKSALIAQGIHLVGAALGDMVPNQAGVNEGAYFAFSNVLGLGSDPAAALSIPLIHRVAQLFLAATCFVVIGLWKGRDPIKGAGPDPSAPSPARSADPTR